MRVLRFALPAIVSAGLLLLLFATWTTDEVAPAPVESTAIAVGAAPTPEPWTSDAVERTPASAPAATVAGAYGARPGTRMLFDFRAETTVDVQQGGDHPARTDQTTTFAGSMLLEVLRHEGDEVIFVASCPDLTMTARVGGRYVEASACEPTIAALGEEVLVRIRSDGAVLGFRFPDSMSFETRLQVRALLALPRFVVPDHPAPTWTTTERDIQGEHTVHYELLATDASRLQIRRQRQACVLPGASDGGAVTTKVVDWSTAEFDLALGWLAQAVCDETTEADLGFADTKVRSHSTCSLRLREFTIGTMRAELNTDGWADADGSADLAADVASRNESAEESLLGDATLHDLVLGLDSVLRDLGQRSQEAEQAVQLLSVFFRRRPWDAAALRHELQLGSLSMTARTDLLSALGRSNTAAAQDLLTGLAGDHGADEELRVAAIFACHQLRQPSPGLASTALAMTQGDPLTSPLPGLALLMLGTCAGRDAALLPRLLDLEPRLLEQGLGGTYIEALRNAQAWDQIERLPRRRAASGGG